MSNNTVNLVGNLTGEPELRFTTGGQAVCNTRMAVNERFQRNGEWVERTTYMNVVAWGTLAENIAASLHKGDRIMASGRIQIREYAPSDDDKRYFTELVATEVGVALRWATVGDVIRPSKELATVGAPANDPVYGDEEPF